jgi:ACS family glucarate transporter-like MFS transporter
MLFNRASSALQHPTGDSAVRWKIVAILMAFSFMNYVNRVTLPVAGDAIRETYGISETVFGTVISVLLWAYTICMLPGGWFSDRFGGRFALAAMGLATAIFCAATGVLGLLVAASQTVLMLTLLWLVRAGMGVFTAPLYPAAGRVVSRWIPFPQRARANALVTGVAMVGIALSYPACGALMDAVGWPMAFIILGIVTAALAILWTLYARDEPRQHASVTATELALIEADAYHGTDAVPAEDRGASWGVVRNRSLWFLTVSYAAVGYVEYLVFYWSGYYFEHVLQFGEQAGRIAAMIPPLCMGLCMPLGGWLCDRLLPIVGYRRCRAVVAMAGMLGSSAALMLATFIESDVAIVSCFAISLAFMGLTEAPAWATAIDLGGRQAATSAAIANTGGNAGGSLSPIVTPWISGLLISYGANLQEGWAWGVRLAGIICLAGALLWCWIDASERHERR